MPTLGPVARKVLAEIRRAPGRDVVDLNVFRQAREHGAAPATEGQTEGLTEGLIDELDDSGLPPGHRMWMRAIAELSDIAWPLLEARPLRKLEERLAESDERYMPGGPPMSPLTDSFHTLWALADASIGLKKESLASIATDLARINGAPPALLRAWHTIAASYPGVYRIERRDDQVVALCELVTGHRAEVELADGVPGGVGDLWWTRLLPPAYDGGYWTSITTPYLLEGGSEMWLAYLERALDGKAAGRRDDAYRRHMKRGAGRFYWFEYILDGYAGERGDVIALCGVPDRPASLPHAAGDESALGEKESGIERLRAKLLRIAKDHGLASLAEEAFAESRTELAGLPDAPPGEWLDFEGRLLLAYAMYGAWDDAGRTALDLLDAQGEPVAADERAAREALRAGWFSVFEIVRIKIGEAIEVRDVLRRRRFWIRERSATSQVALGDLIAGWLMVEAGEHYLEGAVAHVPRLFAAPVIEASQMVMRSLRKDRRLSWKERHADFAPLASAIIARAVAERPPIDLRNHDGEPVILSEATYDVRDKDAVVKELHAANELEPTDEQGVQFAWHHAEKDVLVGECELAEGGRRLVVRTNSRERLLRHRAWLEHRLGAAIEHCADSFSDPQSAAHVSATAEDSRAEELPAEVRDAVAQKLNDSLVPWLDQPIPALGNKTPRQAAKSERGRDDVAAMLLEQERILRRGEQTKGIEFSHLWSELGLRYPENLPGLRNDHE